MSFLSLPLALMLSAATVDADAAALVTELVTARLSEEPRFDVIASGDVRRQLELEAERAAIGCDAQQASCLAEVAGALGANLVVYGKLGTLDDVVILTLNLFDSSRAQAVGRVAVRAPNLAKLADQVDGGVTQLVKPYLASTTTGRVKLLVLDVDPPGKGGPADNDPAASPSSAATSAPLSAMFIGGVSGLVGGALAGGAGALLLFGADDANKRAVAAEDVETAAGAYDERDALGGVGFALAGVGAAGVVAGAVLLGLSFSE